MKHLKEVEMQHLDDCKNNISLHCIKNVTKDRFIHHNSKDHRFADNHDDKKNTDQGAYLFPCSHSFTEIKIKRQRFKFTGFGVSLLTKKSSLVNKGRSKQAIH